MPEASTEIRTELLTACPSCGDQNHETIQDGLRDRLFFAPGTWTFRRCSACRTVFLNPRPIPDEIHKAYTDLYAERKKAGDRSAGPLSGAKDYLRSGYYAARHGYTDGASTPQRLLGAVVARLPFWSSRLSSHIMEIPYRADGRLLDVGCGVGGFMLTMARMGWQVEGVDTDARVVNMCRQHGLPARVGTLESVRYPEHTFDVVTSSHVIEHVYDPVGFLAEIRRVLKPGGRLYLRTPNVDSYGYRLFGQYWLPLEAPRHLFLFDPRTLARAATAAGFTSIHVRSSARASRFIALISLELRDRGRVAYRDRAAMRSRIRASFYAARVRAYLRLGRDIGDELSLIASR